MTEYIYVYTKLKQIRYLPKNLREKKQNMRRTIEKIIILDDRVFVRFYGMVVRVH